MDDSAIIHVKGLPKNYCDAQNVRGLFYEVSIPEGNVHILGGQYGQAFIEIPTKNEELTKIMKRNGVVWNGKKLELRFIDKKQRLEIMKQVRDDGGPSKIQEMQTPNFSRVSNSSIKAEETSEMEQIRKSILKRFEEYRPPNMESNQQSLSYPFATSTLNWRNDEMGTHFRNVQRAPLLTSDSTMPIFNPLNPVGFPNPAIPMPPFPVPLNQLPTTVPFCRDFAQRRMEFPNSGILPPNCGGYWAKCENVDPSWNKEKFYLLLQAMDVRKRYKLEPMMGNQVYVNFTSEEDYLKFLKRCGWLEDEKVPKLDETILCGLQARPCAEVHFAYDKQQEEKQLPFNGPNNDDGANLSEMMKEKLAIQKQQSSVEHQRIDFENRGRFARGRGNFFNRGGRGRFGTKFHFRGKFGYRSNGNRDNSSDRNDMEYPDNPGHPGHNRRADRGNSSRKGDSQRKFYDRDDSNVDHPDNPGYPEDNHRADRGNFTRKGDSPGKIFHRRDDQNVDHRPPRQTVQKSNHDRGHHRGYGRNIFDVPKKRSHTDDHRQSPSAKRSRYSDFSPLRKDSHRSSSSLSDSRKSNEKSGRDRAHRISRDHDK